MRSRVLMFTMGGLLLINVHGQTIDTAICGTYVEALAATEFTRLTLRPDGSFSLKRIDPVFNFTLRSVENEGTWLANDHEVILNPEKQPRAIVVRLEEKADKASDSITVKVEHLLSVYRDEVLDSTGRFKAPRVTIYLNKRKHYYNLVEGVSPYRGCLFSPKLKHPVIIDGSGSAKLARTDLERVGIMTYGFDDIVWIDLKDPKADNLTFTIEQSIDADRRPRSKKVIVRRNKAYIHEWGGKVRTGSSPLVKQ